MQNCKMTMRFHLILLVGALLLGSLPGWSQQQQQRRPKRDTTKTAFVHDIQPFLQGIEWIKDLVKKDTGVSYRTEQLAPLSLITPEWIAQARYSRMIPETWQQYWSSYGGAVEPIYDLLPYYVYHNHQLCYVQGVLAKDSLAILSLVKSQDTLALVLHKSNIPEWLGGYEMAIFPLVKGYYHQPIPIELVQSTKANSGFIPRNLHRNYIHRINNSSDKRRSISMLNDSMIYSMDRAWKIVSQGELCKKPYRKFRIYAIDTKTRRPGYFILNEVGYLGERWELSLTIERVPQSSYQEYFELGSTQVKSPVRPFRIFSRLIWISMYLVLLIGSLALLYAHFNRRKNRQQQRTQLALTGLRAQLNPHFLFNSLTSIQDLMNQDNKPAANRYFNEMAQLLRYVVDSSVEEYTSLAAEVAALEKYCSLEALRTPFQYNFEIHPGVNVQGIEIPTLLLQPFVENAILHGLRPSSGDKKLHIAMWPESDDRLGISISDNGVGIEHSRSEKRSASYKRSHQGIKMTLKRIELLNQGNKHKIELKIEDRSRIKPNQTGTMVQLSIPV